MKFTTNETFILASGSPRRKELFGMLNVPFEVMTSDVDEKSVPFTSEMEYVRNVALLKTRAVASMHKGKTIIGADTIVAFEGKLLHKPQSVEEATMHLKRLRGNTHDVLTAVVIIDRENNEHILVEKTSVTFKQFSDELLGAYVKTGDPFDKAGGYGIQTSGTLLVEKIEGDYNNVVGIPIATLTEQLLTLNMISI